MTAKATEPKPKYRNVHQTSLACRASFSTIQNLIISGRIEPDAFLGDRPLFDELKLEAIREALNRPAISFEA